MTTTRVSKTIHATRAAIYRACLDPALLMQWRFPDNMRAEIHSFDAREGGIYRMSLTYLDPAHSTEGKTTADTDTFTGRFISLIPDLQIIERIDFHSPDPAFAGEMTMTTMLSDANNGAQVTILCEDIPQGIRPKDNELGCRLALDNLARLLER